MKGIVVVAAVGYALGRLTMKWDVERQARHERVIAHHPMSEMIDELFCQRPEDRPARNGASGPGLAGRDAHL